jgi:hypothetical protein
VLDDIGKVAGMEGVTVVHGRGLRHQRVKVTHVIPGRAQREPQMCNCTSGISRFRVWR